MTSYPHRLAATSARLSKLCPLLSWISASIMPNMTSSIVYSTDSAGMHPSHTLPAKLRAIAEAGFLQAELAFPDLEAYAAQEHPGYKTLDEHGIGDLDTLLKVANKVRALCEELGLSILAIHPCVCFYSRVVYEILRDRKVR